MNELTPSNDNVFTAQLAWDDVMTRRVRSLLWVSPFYALRRGEAFRDPELAHYDTLSLAMKVLELSIYSMGLSYGITRKAVLHELKPMLIACDRAAGKTPDHQRHVRIVDIIVGGLINESGRRKHFEETYLDFSEGKAQRRVLSFQIITEEEAPDGNIVLRARPEGINLFTKSFDVDIEDAQAAVEAVVLSQIRRGRIDLAVASAWEACVRSVQFEDKIKRVLEVTRRDIRQVDWEAEVPQMLHAAFNHLTERLSVEREILDTANRHFDNLSSAVAKQEMAKVIKILQDCRQRHLDLHRQLLDVRNTFLSEQERQRFAPVASNALPDLQYDLFFPVLELTRRDARKVTDIFFQSIFPPYPPAVLSLDVLVERLLQRRRYRSEYGDMLEDEELDEVPLNMSRFSATAHERLQALLANLEEPTLLSELLRQARASGWGKEELLLLVLEVLRLYDPEDEEQQEGMASRLWAENSGQTFCDPDFAGDDLLVIPLRSCSQTSIEEGASDSLSPSQ